MRLLRAAAIAFLSLAALLLIAVATALHNQTRLIGAILGHIQESSGYQIVTSDAWLHFGTHLSVVLEHPSIRHDGREMLRSERVRVYLSYHALIWNSGLPLRALVVVRPELRVPVTGDALGAQALPRPDLAAIRAVVQEFREFTGLVERVTIANARVVDAAGQPLLEQFSLTAAPRHRHARIWNVGFIAPHIHMALGGFQVSGRFIINTTAKAIGGPVSGGELWFWDGRLHRDLGSGVTVNGLAHGDATFALRPNGELYGDGKLAIDQFGAGGTRLGHPIDLGNCSLRTIYTISTARIALENMEARVDKATVGSGNFALDDPLGANAAVLAHLSDVRIDLAALKARLEKARALPRPLAWLAAALVSGNVAIEGATYQAKWKDLGWTAAALSKALRFSARLEAVSLQLSNAEALPALSQANAELSYAKGRVTLSQGSAALGGSSLRELSGDADFGLGHRRIRYQLKAAGTLDVEQLYTAAKQLFPARAAQATTHIERLSGHAAIRLTASGAFDTKAPAPPAKYLAKIATSGVSLTAKGLPQPIALVGGSVTVTPGDIELTRVMAAIDKPHVPGAVTASGNLGFAAGKLSLRQVAVELHQIDIQQWLPLIVDPQDIAARGPLGGKLTIARAPSRSQGIRANGRLTMGAGEVQLGFLRSPIVAESATLSFDGRGLLLAIVGAKLQGAPLDFSLGVADLDTPVLRIVAKAGRLDLEVMKFIRLPWAASPPAHFFPVPVVGHIEAEHAKLERLAMSHVRCDFSREINGDWNVRNFAAGFFDGHADMEISGRGRDDWINVKGHLDRVQVGPLFSMADPTRQPPLSGRLEAKGDLWADSNTDFFNTLAGTLSIEVTGGVLHKFALLSRILGFINLETWLSAKVPDPRINGVPFQTLKADFEGRDGDFYSENLLLRGPVMNISALGHILLSNSNVDMEVGMVPFKTVNWLVGRVPIIGSGLSSNHFVAAYFHVTGPLSNPRVVPQPITSVAHFLKNVLKLPLNIIEGIGQSGSGGGGGTN